MPASWDEENVPRVLHALHGSEGRAICGAFVLLLVEQSLPCAIPRYVIHTATVWVVKSEPFSSTR